MTTVWHPDELGDGFEYTTIPLGTDPDGEGTVETVLVRAVPGPGHSIDPAKPALLWVHGMSDYFFQDHVARHYLEQGYPFYGVDLRKCGRAHKADQRWHYTTDMRYYHADLTAVARMLADEHGAIIPMGHSTGGLNVILWADDMRRNDPETHSLIAGLVLNSPWVDLQFPELFIKVAAPVVRAVGKRWPLMTLPISGEATYGESIHAGAHGRWEYDLVKKRPGGHQKYLGWLRAVIEGQAQIHDRDIDTGVPTLTLCSAKSYLGKPYSKEADTADSVLEVEQIKRWAPTLSDNAELAVIDGALHDVFLSQPEVLDEAYRVTDAWIERVSEARP
ncbi:alpha/beta hydrolase [Corynebacterium aquatimens]|uniref:Alpha-beta hydrolase superfamily lysophospholipase n=1 Tax=Corynebacterium aquatimens TaxID=1190508 RepID=A0A931GTI3_9CORY|nr:alpha/beta hydrolase [Corynebacterium aquatimens]MBG6121860.1 alpha-beta hydrolase superfamily lysophospholipase [Corynebacterium aquatimens]